MAASPAEAATVDNSCDLDVTDDTATLPTGTTHTLTATLANEGVAPCDDTTYEIDFEVESGAAVSVTNDDGTNPRTTDADNSPTSPDMTCTITSPGASCIVQFTSATQGTNVVRGWVDDDKDNATFDADATEGRWAGVTDDDPTVPPVSAAGNRTEVDDTDVASVTWAQGFANACIDAEPNGADAASGTNHEITARATNAAAYDAPGSDDDDVFDCSGTALAGAEVTVTITDDDPDTFIASVNGTSTGGPIGGGPDTVDATADANGQVVVEVACVSGAPANCTGDTVVEFDVPGAAAGPSTDSVSVDWAPAGVPASFDASPEDDTNEVGQQHTASCEILDAFGGGVAGQNCDFNITGGPNSTVDVDGNALTPPGYAGQCTTGADGTCSISYTSAATGTDTIHAFQDLNNNDADDGVGEPDDDISATWVAAGAGVTQVALDMDACNGTGAPTDPSWNSTASDPVDTVNELCAQAFSAANAPLTAPVTFTITSGPGHFTDAGGTVDLGSSVTADDTGYAHAFITSTETGETVITATSHGASDTGTQTWTAAEARNIEISAPAFAEPGTPAQATAMVTDKFGNPAPGETVTFNEVGPAIITSANPVVTGPTGEAEVQYESTTEGTSTITASLDDATTDCEELANDPDAGDPAGNCSASAETEWSEEGPPVDGPTTGPCAGFEYGSTNPGAGPNGQTVIVGTEGNDDITGTAGDDIICGLNGDDTLAGEGGNDDIYGNAGNDGITGGGGSDWIRTGGGDDVARGNGGHDALWGQGGADNLRGNKGGDSLFGGQGPDVLRGGRGHDTLRGGNGHDTLKGGRGNDVLNGGRGNDTCGGGRGNDSLKSC